MSAADQIELAFAGPSALAALVRARQVTPRELVEQTLRRIERLDPQLNAFRLTLAEQALAEAGALTDLDGPLAGVPFAVKDETALAGQAVTRGTRSPEPVATHDAVLVARLRAAGAIPVGITNVPELMIFPWTASEANGITRNPWDPSRTPGGSSGGSAAAAAAGVGRFATAADGGGSIRIPAACCGLVGMKPTRGRMPSDTPFGARGGGWLGLAVSGTLAATVLDSALLLDLTHGAVAGDRSCAPPFEGSYAQAAQTPPPTPLRIAVSTRMAPGLLARLSADQRRAFDRAGRLLESLGHHVSERAPAYGTVQIQFLQTWLRAVYEETLTLADRTRLERSTAQMAAAGRHAVPPWRRDRVLGARAATTRRITALWDEFDVLLTPGLATTPIAAEGGYGRSAPVAIDIGGRFTPYTPAFNVTGQPAIVLPAGFGSDGLPLAVQLVGRPGAEHVLYGLAGQLERSGLHERRVPTVA